MLEFYYDCVDRYCNREDLQLMSMDTDSLYMAISAENWTDLIKPDMSTLFDQDKINWFPRSQLPEAAVFDRREPGLFKEEFTGTAMVALCSKTHCVENSVDVQISKFSCIGLKKCNFSHPLPLYKQVLFDKSVAGKTNRGFRARDNTVFTYTQHRQGLTSYYPKRKVLDDGVSTTFLDTELCPDP